MTTGWPNARNRAAASAVTARRTVNPRISPGDAMIAPDFLCLRTFATDDAAVALAEGARKRKKDQQGRIRRSV